MKRWLVFDSPTAAAVQHPERNIEVSTDSSVPDALHEVMQSNRAVVLVVPAGGNQATVARITPPERQSS